MTQRYKDNIKRPKPQDNQLGILKYMQFAGKFSRGPQVQERALLELGSISL